MVVRVIREFLPHAKRKFFEVWKIYLVVNVLFAEKKRELLNVYVYIAFLLPPPCASACV
jgi:hypothetical protein